MRRVLSSIRNNSPSILTFGVGLGIGILLMLPFGFAVSDGVAQVLAAIVTAILAIGGSVLLWQVQEFEKEEQIASGIAMTWLPMFVSVEVILHLIEHECQKDPVPSEEIRTQSLSMKKTIAITTKHLERFAPTLHLLPASKVLAFISLEANLDILTKYQELIAMRSQSTPVPGAAVPLLKGDASKLFRRLQEIRRLLEMLAPGFDRDKRFPPCVSTDVVEAGELLMAEDPNGRGN